MLPLMNEQQSAQKASTFSKRDYTIIYQPNWKILTTWPSLIIFIIDFLVRSISLINIIMSYFYRVLCITLKLQKLIWLFRSFFLNISFKNLTITIIIIHSILSIATALIMILPIKTTEIFNLDIFQLWRLFFQVLT